MISVLLIDDHEVVRIGLRFAIESAFPGSQVAEAGSLAARTWGCGRGGAARALDQARRRDRALIASGLQNKEIGLRLGISDNTVRAHLVTIFRRFELTSRADTKTLVQRLGLGESAQG